MSDKIPSIISRLYGDGNWPMLIYYFRGRWNEQSWLYLKRNGNAVKRIKQEFTNITGFPAYQPATNAMHWDKEIAKYAERLGVALLINDMRQAADKYKPKSIIYFLHATGACRWEMLLMEHIQQEIRERKSAENSDYEEMAKLFQLPVKKIEPEWVEESRTRRRQIKIIMADCQSLTTEKISDLRREMERIDFNLNKFGFAEAQ